MNLSFSGLLEALMLVIALSVDAFFACLAYGSQKIRVPFLSVIIISTICSGILTAAIFLGSLIAPIVSAGLSGAICFVILFLLGAARLFDSSLKAWIRKNKDFNREVKFTAFKLRFILEVYADPEIADLDSGGTLTAWEAAVLAVALSFDGLAAGFGAGAGQISLPFVLIMSLLSTAAALKSGICIGNRLAAKFPIDLSPLSGILLIILAFMNL